uniref:Uncharacterized protein n=1 Tax=Romanomermis culicivorax TaxID=13658 RepID=A0A915IUZ7_ROMCU
MATSSIVETDNSFGQPQDCQDNTSFLISNCNVRRLVRSTDIFNYFTSLFHLPHTAIEEPMFLAPENTKVFNKAVNLLKFRGKEKIRAAVWACACLFMKLLRLGRIPQNFARFHYQAHAYATMKLQREFNARQEGLGNNFHAM